MQERCLAAAYMKTVNNNQQLIQFCSGEEAGRQISPTIGGLSNFKRNK